MSIVAYRIRCDDCTNETVLREDDIEESLWVVNSRTNHSGLCPACNEAVDPDDDSEYSKCHQEVPFEELDSIGDSGASNLREKGIVTRQDVQNASDDEILDTSWVGEKGLQSIRQEVQ
jgi:hypothetical protein